MRKRKIDFKVGECVKLRCYDDRTRFWCKITSIEKDPNGEDIYAVLVIDEKEGTSKIIECRYSALATLNGIEAFKDIDPYIEHLYSKNKLLIVNIRNAMDEIQNRFKLEKIEFDDSTGYPAYFDRENKVITNIKTIRLEKVDFSLRLFCDGYYAWKDCKIFFTTTDNDTERELVERDVDVLELMDSLIAFAGDDLDTFED